MARLYGNENFPRRVSEVLRLLGHDVLTVQEAGQANQGISDELVLLFATRENRAVLTFDRRDFMRLHRQNPNHAGIIVCTQDTDIQRQAQRIHQAVQKAEASSGLRGQLLRVNRPDSA